MIDTKLNQQQVLAQQQEQADQDVSHDTLPIFVLCEFQLPFTVE